MVSKIQPNKVLLDIEECIFQLKQEFSIQKLPINDDNTKLHSLEEKLELILLIGLLEKPGLLGPKKSYWNYICACLSSSKRKHEGINFVKSIPSLKTTIGRGRAFIRFCLSQKCLADTLQVCFMNQKVSKDFYVEKSLPVQESLWSALVNLLYELNDVNFDLNIANTELDITWPKFARKIFTPSEVTNFPRKSMSSSNLQRLSSQDEFNTNVISDSNSMSSLEISVSMDAIKETQVASEHAQMNETICVQNKSLQNKIKQLEGEKSKLELDFQELLRKYQDLQQNSNPQIDAESSEINNIAIKSKVSNLFPIDVVQTSVSESDEEKCLNQKQLNANSSIKLSTNQILVNSTVDCALTNFHEQSSQTSSTLNDSIDTHQTSTILFPQNQIYVTEHLQEIKTVIDDIEDILQKSNVTSAMPYVIRLKRIRNSLEEKVFSDIDKSRNHLIFSQFVENCVSNIKNYISKQENIIDSLQENTNCSVNKNQTLCSKINVLKNLLQSYGFLKIINEKENLPNTTDVSFSCELTEEFSYDSLAHDPLLKRVIVPILPVINSSLSKLNFVSNKVKELDFRIDSAVDLISLLISRLQDQEVHLKGVTKELEEAQNLVAVLKEQHTKLQSAEGILKYDLQEKRKLLSKLRQQLENTREDFNLVRIKNSKSEAEWQDLRNEFVQRHKQTSEESGFLEDKGFEDCENTPSTSSCASNNYSKENTPEIAPLSESPEISDEMALPKKSRLELLEEQCQSLYSNLLQSSKRRIEIDRRLESVCKSVDKTINKNKIQNASSNLPSENTSESPLELSSVDVCENASFSVDNSINTHQSSSDVGSLNFISEGSYTVEVNLDDNYSENFFSSKSKPCVSSSPQYLETVAIPLLASDHDIECADFSPDLDNSLACVEEYKSIDNAMSLPCERTGLTECSEQTLLSHVDSLLLKKKDLEESLRNLAAESDLISSNKAKYLETEEYIKQISILEEERVHLLSKIQELERKTVITSSELDHTKQQLIISETAKEHEVSALQFQLNTEMLKYEQALKEFHEQSKGLENMKQKVTDQEKLILALEEALTEIRMDRESANEEQLQELEDIHTALEMREQECFTLYQDLEKSICDFEEERNRNELLTTQLEELRLDSERDKNSLKSELAFLQNYSQELQKKLVKLLKEKDILWKRSIHLYHLQRDKIDDRWMNDSEVSHCLSCKSSFSFLLRKHHCRLCGRIFCYLCSNNWLSTPSSSKKIRSCNECFTQYIETKKSVRRGSDVPQVDEDSGDDSFSAQLPFIPKSNSSFTSELPSSVNSSILSLPITQKQSTPRFASAPDLQHLFKANESSCSNSMTAETTLEKTDDKLSVADSSVKEADNLSLESIQHENPSEPQNNTRSVMLGEVTVNDIKEAGKELKGELNICSERKAEFLISCESCPVKLQWCFSANYQDIPFAVMHKTEKHSDAPTFCCQEPKMKDGLVLNNPGYYAFCFDNFNRSTDVKIQYSFSFEDVMS